MANIPSFSLPNGEHIAVLGQGTWQMAMSRARRADEIKALQAGIDLGMTLIDTAEMYGSGDAEELLAEAIAGRRDEVFLVSKVLPENSSRNGTIKACERSLKRLRTGTLDLYLLHWRGSFPLSETVDAFETLVKAGKIRSWGVSNFDVEDMQELMALPGGKACAINQVLFNLSRRGIEQGLIPWSRKHNIPIMAYSPVEQGRLLGEPALRKVAERLNATPAQVALAWVLAHPDICAIPKAGRVEHVRENHAALSLRLTKEDMAALDAAFPPPGRPMPLEML
ncbi:MAG TPA: aldo/keto reductase [Xanthobacteraceae bacterium]|nr:aldo/keto reductase [Xanthobacteraceae bacterium]